jgi:hypothetical protein
MVPDPSTIRPASVLRAALKMVLQRWSERTDSERSTAGSDGESTTYTWVTSQLRSIRQDLTVQNLRGKVARRCYIAAVRCALDARDWAEFSPSLSRLFELYSEEGDAPPAEFHAYRMLKLIAEALRLRTSNSLSLTEQLRSLVANFPTAAGHGASGAGAGISPKAQLDRGCSRHKGVKSSLFIAPALMHARALLEAIAGGKLYRALVLSSVDTVEKHGQAVWLVQEQIAAPLRAMQDAMMAKAVRSQSVRRISPAPADAGAPAPAKDGGGGKGSAAATVPSEDAAAATATDDAELAKLLAENVALKAAKKKEKKANRKAKQKAKQSAGRKLSKKSKRE